MTGWLLALYFICGAFTLGWAMATDEEQNTEPKLIDELDFLNGFILILIWPVIAGGLTYQALNRRKKTSDNCDTEEITE